MEVKLDKQYPLDVDAARAWALLTDLKATANCMPGAEITEQLSETSFKGGVKVKVGPAVAQFGGQVDVLEKDEAGRPQTLEDRRGWAGRRGHVALRTVAGRIEEDVRSSVLAREPENLS